MLSADTVNLFFSLAPLVVFSVILLVTYLATRNQQHAAATIGKTFACAQCGRRGKHEHMVPVAREGAVLWYCGRCAH